MKNTQKIYHQLARTDEARLLQACVEEDIGLQAQSLMTVGLFCDEACVAEKWDMSGTNVVGGIWSEDLDQDRSRLDPESTEELQDQHRAKLMMDWLIKKLDFPVPWPLLCCPVAANHCSVKNMTETLFHLIRCIMAGGLMRVATFGSDGHAGFHHIHRILPGLLQIPKSCAMGLTFEVLAPLYKRWPFGLPPLIPFCLPHPHIFHFPLYMLKSLLTFILSYVSVV
jgi:hypothetical protein